MDENLQSVKASALKQHIDDELQFCISIFSCTIKCVCAHLLEMHEENTGNG